MAKARVKRLPLSLALPAATISKKRLGRRMNTYKKMKLREFHNAGGRAFVHKWPIMEPR